MGTTPNSVQGFLANTNSPIAGLVAPNSVVLNNNLSFSQAQNAVLGNTQAITETFTDPNFIVETGALVGTGGVTGIVAKSLAKSALGKVVLETVGAGVSAVGRFLGLVPKNTPKLLNQFNSVDSLLGNAGKFTRLKGGIQQAVIKGDGNSIFKAISQGGKQLQSGAVKLSDGTILNKHLSTNTGQLTIDINKGGQLFKKTINTSEPIQQC